MVDTCHYTFVKTYRIYNTKSEPWILTMDFGWYVSVGSSVVTNVPLEDGGDVESGGGGATWG